MGIKLGDIIPRKELSFNDLNKKKIVIDASNMLYQFISSIRQPDGTPLTDSKGRITSHLQGTFYRLSNLMQKGCSIAVCFDGKPPLLKIHEKEQREHRKRLAEEKLKRAKEEGDEELMLKYSKQTSRLTFEMTNEVKELIKAMGLPVIQSPSESDAQISFMCERGDVDYAASSDYDCLLHGCPKLLFNLTLSQRRKIRNTYVTVNPEMMELTEILKTLDINQDQLIILSILCGTDYNIGGVKGIGPKNALKLVKQNKDFDKLFNELKPDFNWKEIYAVFKSMPIMKNYQLKWTEVDEDKIRKILIDKHDFSEERVNKMLERVTKKKKNQIGLSSFLNT